MPKKYQTQLGDYVLSLYIPTRFLSFFSLSLYLSSLSLPLSLSRSISLFSLSLSLSLSLVFLFSLSLSLSSLSLSLCVSLYSFHLSERESDRPCKVKSCSQASLGLVVLLTACAYYPNNPKERDHQQVSNHVIKSPQNFFKRLWRQKDPSCQTLHFMGKTGHSKGKGKLSSRQNYPSEVKCSPHFRWEGKFDPKRSLGYKVGSWQNGFFIDFYF